MSLFKKLESPIFKDASWLHPLSPPPGGKPLGREEDLKYMAFLLSNLFKTGKGRNIFVFGKPGTGKTLCVKYLLKEIQKHAEQEKIPLATVYVNAGKTRSPYYTMLEIVKGLGSEVPESGWQMFRLKHAFEKATEEKAVVVAVDEVESLLLKEKEPLVYYLNRQPKTTLILVSNKIEDIAELPERAHSTLQLKVIPLESYTPEEAETILAERIEKALHTGVLTENLIRYMAKIAATAEDIRFAFSMILQGGRLAEDQGKKVIESQDLSKAGEEEIRLKKIKALLEQKRALKRH